MGFGFGISWLTGYTQLVCVLQSNITPEERNALKDIKKNEELMVLPADKGRAVVLLDTRRR